jgi:plasmid stability protein
MEVLWVDGSASDQVTAEPIHFYSRRKPMIAAVRDGKIRLNLEGANVAKITVRNISEDLLHALRLRASRHGKSVEDEARDILSCAVNAHSRVKLGSLLAEIGRKAPSALRKAAALDARLLSHCCSLQ